MPALQRRAGAPAGSHSGGEPVLQQPTPPLQQQYVAAAPSPTAYSYSKVASWLNSCSSSSSGGSSGSYGSGSRPGAPLLARAASLLCCLGLGGLLQPQAAGGSGGLQRQAAAAVAARRSTAAASEAGGSSGLVQAKPVAAPAGHGSGGSGPLQQHLSPATPHGSASGFPASHPLTQQQLEQSAGLSTSAAAGAAAAAPVGAVAKAAKARGALVLGPAAAAAVKAGDDVIALLASLPRTLRTLQWAAQAAAAYKRLMLTMEPGLDPAECARRLSQLHDHWAQRLTEVCRVNGGVYVKAGQFAAAFGAVPQEYRQHLALLQDKAKPRPFHVVDRVLRLELGARAEQVFEEFSAEATAAASLAQVHKARLADGSWVAVKVQYPGLRGAANADLSTLSLLSGVAGALFPEFRLGWLYEELAHKLEEELDFHVEVRNGQRLMELMAPGSQASSKGGSSGSGGGGSSKGGSSKGAVTVPRAHVELCTSKVLTMEWIDGLKVSDTPALRGARISPRAVGRAVDEAFAEMTFLHGYIHSDPHPGNIMVRPKGRRGLLSWLLRGSWQPFEVVLLDHGSYLSIPERLRLKYCQLWCALFVQDTPGAASVAIELGGQRAGQILPVILTQRGRNRQEQREMQRAAGVASFGDITQLLATAPRDVVELLRIAAVVRNVTAGLGCSLADRLRINGAWALHGLGGAAGGWLGGGGGGGGSSAAADSEADRRFAQLSYRLNIAGRLLLIRGYLAANALMQRLLLASLAAFGQPVVLCD